MQWGKAIGRSHDHNPARRVIPAWVMRGCFPPVRWRWFRWLGIGRARGGRGSDLLGSIRRVVRRNTASRRMIGPRSEQDTDDVGAPADFLVQPLVGPVLPPDLFGECRGRPSRVQVVAMFASFSMSASSIRSCWLATDAASAWLNIECSRVRTEGQEFFGPFVRPRSRTDRAGPADRAINPGMGVGGQRDAGQAAGDQITENANQPARSVPDMTWMPRIPGILGVHAGGDQTMRVDHPTVLLDFEHQRVGGEKRVRTLIERPSAERPDLSTKIGYPVIGGSGVRLVGLGEPRSVPVLTRRLGSQSRSRPNSRS